MMSQMHSQMMQGQGGMHGGMNGPTGDARRYRRGNAWSAI